METHNTLFGTKVNNVSVNFVTLQQLKKYPKLTPKIQE